MESILNEAKQQEKDYDWNGAAESLQKSLSYMLGQDLSKAAEIQERRAFDLYKAAMQAETEQDFKNKINEAITAYEVARKSYISTSRSKTARTSRCHAFIAYLNHWLTSEISEKKKMLEECWQLTKESLDASEEAKDSFEYGKTFNQLSSTAIFIFTREASFKSREHVMQEVAESGEKAIQSLLDSGDSNELARVCAKTVVYLGVLSYYFRDIDEREKYRRKGLNYWNKAKELAGEIAMTEFLCPVFGCQPFFGLEGTDEAFANYEEALEYARKTKDKFLVGCALDWLIYHTAWKIVATVDPDYERVLAEKILTYAKEARNQFSKISFTSPRGDMLWLGEVEDAIWIWRADSETDLEKRRTLFEKGLQNAREVQKQAEKSGYPELMLRVHSINAGLDQQLAGFETSPSEKKKLLEKALSHSNESVRIADQLEPYLYWNRGVMRDQSSVIKFGLSELAEETETKKTLLQESVSDKEKAIELCVRELNYFERKESGTSLSASVGRMQYTYGNILVHLNLLTGDRKLLVKAIEAYEEAIGSHQKLNMKSRIAEDYWKKAQVYDRLEEYQSAYQSFEMARANYAFASENILQLKDLYRDQAIYMHAWAHIEKAKLHHEKQDYGLAEEHFEKASKLHEQLKRWNYLAPNYGAWAQTDRAEELSRKENSEEALQAFEKAAGLFEETRKSLKNHLDTIEDLEEKQMAKDMLRATVFRHHYCMARIAIEEAKIFDKKGDHFSSSEKYDSVGDILRKAGETGESERDKRELDLIATLSQAWAKMTLAEAEENPSPYTEASQLFEKAKELSSNETAKALALGHSRFCKALEAGMRFADTRNEQLHTIAIEHLESAGRYYVKASCPSASEYARATELLLDAYSTISNAKKEVDPEKKTRLLAVAEKILQTSAGSFMKAEHPEKREQILRLLEKVKEERELSQSLNEVLHTPSVVSTTAAFATPTPVQENSLGLERFESANIQANIIAHHKKLRIGEKLELEIELVNAGKGSAQLVKIAELVPHGFKLTEKPESYRVEDSYLNLKGKRINPLKTEEVKLTLMPMIKGEFSLKPNILYIDENGEYKSYEPEPIGITVKESGIKDWLKGDR